MQTEPAENQPLPLSTALMSQSILALPGIRRLHRQTVLPRGWSVGFLLAAWMGSSPARCAAQAEGVAPAPSPTPPALQTVAPGVYRLGEVTLDKNTRQVHFPAVVNQTAGPVEYLLVGNRGKVHESVLRTRVEPTQVHTALLLLGLKAPAGQGTAAPVQPPAALDSAYLAAAPLPPGVPVTLLVRWQPAGATVPVDHRAESLVDGGGTKTPMTDGDWLYNGSTVRDGRFQAEIEKSFVAVVTDPDALLNNPRPGHDNETLWTAATARLPEVGTPVEFIIQLSPAAAP